MSPNTHMTTYAVLGCAYLAKGLRHGEGDDIAIATVYLSLSSGCELQLGAKWLKIQAQQVLTKLCLRATRFANALSRMVRRILR
jgi:hypothetical protein